MATRKWATKFHCHPDKEFESAQEASLFAKENGVEVEFVCGGVSHKIGPNDVLFESVSPRRFGQTQKTFPWYDPSEYEPMADPNWPDPTKNPLGTLTELLETSPQGVNEFLDHFSQIYNPKTISFQNACVSPADPLVTVTIRNRVYVVDFSSENVEEAHEWLSGIWDHNLANFVPCPDHNVEFWDGIREGPGTILYHATDSENLESIKRKGLQAASETRSMSNKGMTDAVFTSWNENAIGSYGDMVIAIDVGLMKQDGYMPRVSKEGPFEDEEMRSALAYKLGIEYDAYSQYASEGLSEETVAFYGNIPPKYLSFT